IRCVGARRSDLSRYSDRHCARNCRGCIAGIGGGVVDLAKTDSETRPLGRVRSSNTAEGTLPHGRVTAAKHGVAPWAFPYGATERAPESSGSIFRKRCLKSPGL